MKQRGLLLFVSLLASTATFAIPAHRQTERLIPFSPTIHFVERDDTLPRAKMYTNSLADFQSDTTWASYKVENLPEFHSGTPSSGIGYINEAQIIVPYLPESPYVVFSNGYSDYGKGSWYLNDDLVAKDTNYYWQKNIEIGGTYPLPTMKMAKVQLTNTSEVVFNDYQFGALFTSYYTKYGFENSLSVAPEWASMTQCAMYTEDPGSYGNDWTFLAAGQYGSYACGTGLMPDPTKTGEYFDTIFAPITNKDIMYFSNISVGVYTNGTVLGENDSVQLGIYSLSSKGAIDWTNPLYTAYATIDDYNDYEDGQTGWYGTLEFNFYEEDEWGTLMQVPAIVEGNFVVAFININKGTANFGIIQDYYSPFPGNTWLIKNGKTTQMWQSPSNMLINFYGVLPAALMPDTVSCQISEAQSITLDVTNNVRDEYWHISELPDWLTIGIEGEYDTIPNEGYEEGYYLEYKYNTKLTADFESLPNNIVYREAEVSLDLAGKKYTIPFCQGIKEGQEEVKILADSKCGITTGAGIYHKGTVVTISAKANYGYHFVQWSDGNTDNPRSFVVTQDSTFEAWFDKDTFTITTAANYPERGITKGDTSALYLDTITISATANYGYHFTRWSDGNTDNPRQVQVTGDKIYTAQFDKNTYSITQNAINGSVSGPSSSSYLDTISLTANPNYGYHFVQWSDGNTDNPRTFVLTQDTTFEAQFAKNLYSITTAVSDPVRGVAKGDTIVEYMETVSISATPNYGYHFTQWSDGVKDNPRSIVITQDTTFEALFDKNTYSITQTAINGSISGPSSSSYLDTISLTANPNYGYHFVQWSDGNTDNPRSFVLTQDTTFEAQFALYYSGQCGDNVTWQYTNDTLTISGTGALYNYTSTTMPWVLLRDSISVIVLDSGITSIGNYCFYGCSLIREITFGKQLITIGSYAFAGCNNIRSITCLASTLISIQSTTMNGVSNYAKVNVPPLLEEDYQFDVNWSRFVIVPMGNMFTVTISATNGSVTGAGKYLENSSVTLTATANTGYHFTQWSDGNTDNPRSFVLTQDTTFEAQFAKNVYSIMTAVNDPVRGVVKGDTIVEYMETISILATANYGYHFTQWNDGNTSNPRQIQVTSDKTYTAQFDKNQYTVSTAKDANTVSVTAGGTYNYLDEVILTVVSSINYQFDHWSDGNTDNPRTLIVTQDTSLTAFSSKIRSGQCGDDLTWLYNNGTLVISGNGEMYDYAQGTASWAPLFKDSITNVVINNGCTSIGNYAFFGLSNKNFKTIDLPNSIEKIGQYSFANCEYLKNLYMGTLLEKISANAFANDERLLFITCYATEPPLLDESAFVNYDIYLSVPCEALAEYKVAKGWKKFNKENIKCIGAEETTVTNDDVTVNPNENDAAFTWPTNTQAASYSLQITKDGVVFCTLTFNSLGQLIGLAFAPGRGAAMEATEQAAIQSGNGFTFTVTGLNSASAYAFNMDVKDSGNQTIKSYTGTFQTKGTPTNLNHLTDSPSDQFTKIIKDGQLYILRDGKTYNAQGTEVR